MFYVNQYESFMNQFMNNDFIKQATENQKMFVKMTETNMEKVQSYFKEHDIFNVEKQMKEFEQFFHSNEIFKNFSHAQQLYLDQFNKVLKVSKEHQDKTKELFEEHRELATQFKDELTASVQTKDVKNVVTAIKNYSKAVTASNVEVLDKSVKKLKVSLAA
jgi:hypothetical protein